MAPLYNNNTMANVHNKIKVICECSKIYIRRHCHLVFIGFGFIICEQSIYTGEHSIQQESFIV